MTSDAWFDSGVRNLKLRSSSGQETAVSRLAHGFDFHTPYELYRLCSSGAERSSCKGEVWGSIPYIGSRSRPILPSSAFQSLMRYKPEEYSMNYMTHVLHRLATMELT